jgi:cobalt/nickel transport system permease protein
VHHTLFGSVNENRLISRHPAEKLLFSGGFLIIVFLLPPWPWSIVIAALLTTAGLAGARIPLRTWFGFLAAPLSFLLLSSMGVLFELDLRSGLEVRWAEGGYQTALNLLLRSGAAITALAFLGLTTPVPELLAIFQRVGVPAGLIELAAVLYRFLGISLQALEEMRRAQSWRMGEGSRRARLQAASMLAGSLFVRCMEHARRLENGLAGRSYTGDLHLLALHERVSAGMLILIAALQLTFVLFAMLVDGGNAWQLL